MDISPASKLEFKTESVRKEFDIVDVELGQNLGARRRLPELKQDNSSDDKEVKLDSEIPNCIDDICTPALEENLDKSKNDFNHQEWVSMDMGRFGRLFDNSEETPLNEQLKLLKIKAINESLANSNFDELVESLRSTDGLISNELRKLVWPVLLQIKYSSTSKDSNGMDSKISSSHRDKDQVVLDIRRSFSILAGLDYSVDDIQFLKKKLFNLIIRILHKYPALNYYQGYHDIASIIVIVHYDNTTKKLDETLCFQMLETLTLYHLRDFMLRDINLSLHHLKLIPTLLEIVDYKFFKLLKQVNNSYIASHGSIYDYGFYLGISSILTMFSHDIENLHQLLIVWDFILSYNSIIISVYIYVAALMLKKDDIYHRLGISDESTDFDKDHLHTLVSPSSIFKTVTDCDILKILNNAKFYYENYPINNLSNSTFTYDLWFKDYNRHSVLLTSSTKSLSLEPPMILIDNNAELSHIMQIQDNEMDRLMAYNLSVEKVYDSDDTEYDNSGINSLSSSLSSLQSSTSSFNTKLLQTSSLYFKKILFHDDDKTPIQHNNRFKLTTLYKFSLTMGFLGFVVHFLLAKNNANVSGLASKYVSETFTFVQNSPVVNNGLFGKIGLGNLKNNIYGFF